MAPFQNQKAAIKSAVNVDDLEASKTPESCFMQSTGINARTVQIMPLTQASLGKL